MTKPASPEKTFTENDQSGSRSIQIAFHLDESRLVGQV